MNRSILGRFKRLLDFQRLRAPKFILLREVALLFRALRPKRSGQSDEGERKENDGNNV